MDARSPSPLFFHSPSADVVSSHWDSVLPRELEAQIFWETDWVLLSQ